MKATCQRHRVDLIPDDPKESRVEIYADGSTEFEGWNCPGFSKEVEDLVTDTPEGQREWDRLFKDCYDTWHVEL